MAEASEEPLREKRLGVIYSSRKKQHMQLPIPSSALKQSVVKIPIVTHMLRHACGQRLLNMYQYTYLALRNGFKSLSKQKSTEEPIEVDFPSE